MAETKPTGTFINVTPSFQRYNNIMFPRVFSVSSEIRGIAVDPVEKELYFADNTRIEVITTNGSRRPTLKIETGRIYTLTVDLKNR